jgi:hypothetical protein
MKKLIIVIVICLLGYIVYTHYWDTWFPNGIWGKAKTEERKRDNKKNRQKQYVPEKKWQGMERQKIKKKKQKVPEGATCVPGFTVDNNNPACVKPKPRRNTHVIRTITHTETRRNGYRIIIDKVHTKTIQY